VLDRDGQRPALPLVTIIPVSEAKVGNLYLEETLVDNTAERWRARRCGKWSGSSSWEHPPVAASFTTLSVISGTVETQYEGAFNFRQPRMASR
jgi:hypothetical protein